jgi:hypothetical protein
MKNAEIEVEIPISECDLEMFADIALRGEKADWIFPSKDGKKMVNIFFVQEDEGGEEDE